MLDRGLAEDGAAQALGWPKARVTARVKILELPETAQEMIGAGRIALSAIDQLRVIGRVSPPLLDAVVAFLADGNEWAAGRVTREPGWVLDSAQLRDRWIVRDPDIKNGEPIINGSRVSVHKLADRIVDGESDDVLDEDFPHIPAEAREIAVQYARANPRRGRPKRRGPIAHAGAGRARTRTGGNVQPRPRRARGIMENRLGRTSGCRSFSMPLRSGEGSASGILSAASAMAVRSLGPRTTMSFRLAIGH
jgi:uncharacterized protein (DUF433 family)